MDGLDLGVAQKLVDAFLAAKAGVLEAAERRAVEVAGRAVDPYIARLHRARGAQCRAQIVGEDRRGEPVLRRIGKRERLVLVLPGEHGQHRPKNLLTRDPHIRIDVGEHGGFEPIAALEIAAGRPLAAGHQLGAVGNARLHH